MIRRFLAREVQRLLQEFDAPDIRTLWHRICFWAYFYISCSILLGGLVALYSLFGLAAMWLGVVAIYLLHIWLLRRTPVYCGDGSEFGLDLQAHRRSVGQARLSRRAVRGLSRTDRDQTRNGSENNAP